jgi:hypothetical protein
MEVGDHHNVERGQRTPLDAALDALNEALTDLIATVDNGALEQLKAEEKVAVWQRFETIRHQLPVVDHRLIAAAEVSHLAEEYCSSTLSQFLVRVLQLSHGEAASRLRAAAAVGPPQHHVGREAGAGAAAAGGAAKPRKRRRVACSADRSRSAPPRRRLPAHKQAQKRQPLETPTHWANTLGCRGVRSEPVNRAPDQRGGPTVQVVRLASEYLAKPVRKGRRLTSESSVVARKFGGRQPEILSQRATATMGQLAS